MNKIKPNTSTKDKVRRKLENAGYSYQHCSCKSGLYGKVAQNSDDSGKGAVPESGWYVLLSFCIFCPKGAGKEGMISMGNILASQLLS